ncbi:uncharacterized protein LOC120342837 isoform X2 [Styela clava]
MRQGEMAAIGFDIGTTFLCVGVCVNGKVQIIPNEHEARQTPAYIAFTDEERLFGGAARHQAPVNLKNTLHSIKRLIGRSAADRHVRQHLKYVGYDVNADQNENCQIPITSYKNRKRLYPEQVTAMMIGKMKKIAEDHLEVKVTKAVLSVPAGFTDFQRQSTMNAGRMAGFEEVCLMNEPTAAALAFAHDKKSKTSKTILIFDFGGGKLEISLFRIDGKNVEVIHHFGDDELGGEDFDNKLVQTVFDDFRQKGIDLSENKKILHRLRIACEKAKKNFSSTVRTRIQVDNLHNNEPFESVITIEQFETITADLFGKVENLVNKTINFINEHHYQVDEIVLIGGSSRIPKVRRILQDCFNGKDLNRTINPDEAVAYGAAVQAAILFNDKEMEEFKISNDSDFSAVTPSDAINEQIREVEEFDKRDEILRQESEARNNLEKYAYRIKKMANTPKYKEDKQRICAECDRVLNWLGGDERRSKKDSEEQLKNLKIFFDSITNGNQPYQIHEVEEFDKRDEILRQESEARNNLEKYAYRIKKMANTPKYKEDKQRICAECDRVLNWLGGDERRSKKDSEEQLKNLKIFFDSITNGNQPYQEPVEKARKVEQEQNTNEEIRNFQEYIQFVQDYRVFQEYKKYLASDEERDIKNKCSDMSQFLNEISENFNINQVRSKRLGFEDFFSGILHRLQHRAQLAYQERDEAIRSFQNYIRSVQTYQIFGDYASLLTSAEQNEVNKRCQELGQMLNENQKNLDIETIDAERRKLEDFIESLIESLEHKYQEKERKQKQELRGAIQNFRDYILSVQQHKIFKQFGRLLTPEDRNEIHGNCAAAEEFLDSNPGTLKQIREQHLQLKLFAESMVKGLEDEAQEEKRKQEQELRVAIQRFRDYIRSVQQHEIFKQVETFITHEDRNEIRGKCSAAEKFLNFNPKNLKKIYEQHSKFESFVERMLNRLENQAQEKKSKKEQELHYAIQSFRDYIRSVQQHDVFRQQERFITREDQNEIGGKCFAAEKFLNDNPENLEQIREQHSKCKRFVESISNRLENQAQEEKRKQEQELRVAIQSFRDYIRSVQQHEVFKQYERFMTPEDHNKIREKCSATEKFFEYDPKNLNLKQIHEKHLKMEQFVERILNKLRQAQDAYLKQKREKEKEQNEAIRKFQEYIPSVERHTEFGHYQKFLTPDDKDDIKEECIRLKKFLSANPEKLELNQIQEEHSNFMKFVESILKRLHQAQVADQETKRKNEQERHKAIRKFEQYVHSVKIHNIFGDYQTFLAPDEKEAIKVECIKLMDFLSGNSEMPDISQIQSEKEKFQTYVDDVLEKLQKRAEKEERMKQQLNQAIQKFEQYIRSVKELSVFKPYGIYLLQGDKDLIDGRCEEMNTFLNSKNLNMKRIEDKTAEFGVFVNRVLDGLKHKAQLDEQKRKYEEQKKIEEIQDFQKFIKSVRSYAEFQKYEEFLSDNDKKEIDDKCIESEEFLKNKQKKLDIQQIQDKKRELEDFVKSLMESLKQRYKLEKQKKMKQEQKRLEVIRDFDQYINSVQDHTVFQKYEKFLSHNDKEEINIKCLEAKEFLKKLQGNLDTKQINEKRSEFEDFVKSLKDDLKQKYKAYKERQQEKQNELNKAIKNFQQYIQSVQNLEPFTEYDKFLSSDDKKDVDDKCLRMNKFLSTNRESLDINQVKENRLKFENFVASMLKSLKQKSQLVDIVTKKKREKEQKKNEVIQNFQQYIRSVESHAEFKAYTKFLTSDDKTEINAKCLTMKEILSNNEEKLSVEQIQDVKIEFEDFVTDIVKKLKDRDEEDQKQKLEEAIQNFQSHIQSVKDLKEFAQYETYLTSTDISEINAKCISAQSFINENIGNLYIKQIEDKRAEFESFIQSIVTKLQSKAQMAAHKIKEEERKQWDEAHRNLRKLLDSVRTQITNRHLGEAFSQYIENIKHTCNEAEGWLQRSQKTITVEELESKVIEVETNLKTFWSGLKQEIQVIEAEKQQQANKERKLTETRDNLMGYLDSIRQMCESEQIAGTEYADKLSGLCSETEEWLKSEGISAESIQTKHEELQATVQEIKQSISKMKQEREAEENLRQKAFDNMWNYIDEVQTKIATDVENDEFTRPHINRITESCEIVLEWVKKNYDRITSGTIISEQRNLRTTIEDIYDKMQASKTEEEEMFRQQALTAVHDYIDDVCKSLEAERETDKTIVQCIDTIYNHCTNVFKWTNENYHQITGGRILSEFDNLQKNVNAIFNVLQARKIEVEAERERQRAETIRKRADVINNLRAYISDVKSLVVFENFKNRLAEEDLRLIFGQCDIAESHIKNSDTNQLEVHYSDLRKLTEHFYFKLERIDMAEKAELARRQAEERRKKAEMCQKLKNYIDRVECLTAFEPYTHRLTKNDEARIQSECIKANHFLIAENLTSFEIERKRKELEEWVQTIYKKLKTREEIATKCKDYPIEWNKAEESLSKCINYWKQFVTRNRRKNKFTDGYLNKIVEIYTEAEEWLLVSYQMISRRELIDKRFNLETDASNIQKSLQDEKQKRDQEIVEATEEIEMFIDRVRSQAVFGEDICKLTLEDIKSITRKCDNLQEWLETYPNKDEIKKQKTELEEFVKRMRNRIKREEEQAAERKKKAVAKRIKRLEMLENIKSYVEEAGIFVQSNEALTSFRDKKNILDLCQEAKRRVNSYWLYSLEELRSICDELLNAVEKARKNILEENKRRSYESDKRRRDEAETILRDYISYIRSCVSVIKLEKNKDKLLTTCEETEKFLQKKKTNLTTQEIEDIEEDIKKHFESIYYGPEIENESFGIDRSSRFMSENAERRRHSRKKETKESQQTEKRVTPTKWIAELWRIPEKIRENMKHVQPKMTDSEKNRLQKLCKETEEWCQNNQHAKKREAEFERRKLEELWTNTHQRIKSREENVDFWRSPNARYLLQPEDSKTALLKLALLARRKIHSHIYKTQIPDSDRNKIITKYNEVIERVWTKEKAERELMEFKQLCIKVFKKVDENADPQRMDVERRWY